MLKLIKNKDKPKIINTDAIQGNFKKKTKEF